VRRREFIAATGVLLVSPPRSRAQGKPRRLGFLSIIDVPTTRKAWLDGLASHGWIDGRNLIIEYRFAQSQDRLPAVAAELVALGPDLLVTTNSQSAVALKAATASIPIVFVALSDPVGIGVVQSIPRPGGNITGFASYVPGDFVPKRIEILREMLPSASKIAILMNPGNPVHRLVIAEEVSSTVRNLGVALPIVEATTAEELDTAFASAAAQHADAIIVFADNQTTNPHASRVVALAAKHRLPAIYFFREFANGGLIVFGPDIADLFRRAGGYVDKILNGTKPADLPIEQPTKFEMVINLKTAKALGLSVPPSLLVRADEVIE